MGIFKPWRTAGLHLAFLFELGQPSTRISLVGAGRLVVTALTPYFATNGVKPKWLRSTPLLPGFWKTNLLPLKLPTGLFSKERMSWWAVSQRFPTISTEGHFEPSRCSIIGDHPDSLLRLPFHHGISLFHASCPRNHVMALPMQRTPFMLRSCDLTR